MSVPNASRTSVAMTVGPDVPTRRRTAESRLPLPESDRSALRTNVPAILLFGTSGLLLAVSMLHGAGSTDRMVFPLGAAALGLIVLALAGGSQTDCRSRGSSTIAWVGIALLGRARALVRRLDRLVAVSGALVGVRQPD